MHLSRLVLDPRSYLVRRDLANCQAMHRTLLAVFGCARSEAGLLYRIEDAVSGAIVVYVQSREPPNWNQLPTGYLARPDPFDLSPRQNPEAKDVTRQYSDLPAGLRLAFRLRANPTRKIQTRSSEGRRNGSRVELHREEDQRAWLQRKATQHGFEILESGGAPEVRVVRGDKIGGHRVRGEREEKLTFGSVLFEGALRITDPARFRAALEGGIGSGKAYGFGLLSIAPLR